MELGRFLAFLVISTSCSFLSDAYRILAIFPYNGRSQHLMFDTIAKALARRGHRVDVMSYFPVKKPLPNYTDIFNFTEEHHGGYLEFSKRFSGSEDDTTIRFATTVLGNEVCELLALPEMQEFIRNPPDDPPYDLVLAQYHTSHCYMALGWLLKVPVVGVMTTLETAYLEDSTGNPLNDAFHPRYHSKKTRLEGFWDRAHNFLNNIRYKRMYHRYTQPQTEIMRKYISPNVPDIREIEKNLALVLLNTYRTFHGNRPLAQVLVEIGGVHIQEDSPNLTPDLKAWMDAATSGVVYFSLGTIIDHSNVPPRMFRDLCASFAKIAPVKVLLRGPSRTQVPANISDNILLSPWAPQMSVLRHKNTRVFITHGGQMSSFETVHFGVPVVGIPVFGDQRRNVDILVAKRMGVRVNFEDVTEARLDAALNTVLNNPEYARAAKRESALFRDRPMKPIDVAIFWIEYVARNGPDVLKSAAADLPWWQRHLIDVYVFLMTCVLLGFLLLTMLVKMALGYLVNRYVQASRSKQKQN